MPPPANIVAAMEVVLEEIRNGAVTNEYFAKTGGSMTHTVPQTKWLGGPLEFTRLGLSSSVPPHHIGYQIGFGQFAPYKYVLYVNNPSDDVAVNRRAVLGGYRVLITSPFTAYMMTTVDAVTYA